MCNTQNFCVIVPTQRGWHTSDSIGEFENEISYGHYGRDWTPFRALISLSVGAGRVYKMRDLESTLEHYTDGEIVAAVM